MDALALAVAPLYDSLTMEEEGKGGTKKELGEVLVTFHVHFFLLHELMITKNELMSFGNEL
jgi:hypothetical protein